jgi:hypothetical protein
MSNVVLVHGGFVDGSGWEPVYQLLRRAGHDVSVVQNPTISLTGDVAAFRGITQIMLAFGLRHVETAPGTGPRSNSED